LIFVGIDENGLGPRLGPLVVTAVSAHCAHTAGQACELPRRAFRVRLDDSKRLISYGDNALGEAWARAIVRRMGSDERTPDAVVRALSLDGPAALLAPCPDEHAKQCWAILGEQFGAPDELVASVERDLADIEDRGVDVTRAACVITCARRLHDADARGLSRLQVDLHAMERLALDARRDAGGDVDITCGKVGGYDRYGPAFGPLKGFDCSPLEEGRARSAYAVAGVGRLAFVRDADSSHALVAMASLAGKWVRDLLMARVVRHHRQGDASLPDVSGYGDPKTMRFIQGTSLERQRSGLPRECFERPGKTGTTSPSSRASRPFLPSKA